MILPPPFGFVQHSCHAQAQQGIADGGARGLAAAGQFGFALEHRTIGLGFGHDGGGQFSTDQRAQAQRRIVVGQPFRRPLRPLPLGGNVDDRKALLRGMPCLSLWMKL